MIPSRITVEKREKLILSEQEAAKLSSRDIMCPNCCFRINTVFSDIRGHMKVKCQKCKNEYILNLAYFRTMGNNQIVPVVYLKKTEY